MVVLYLMKSKIDSIGVIKFYYVISNESINQGKNIFERNIMILRNITWIHSLILIEVIKRCCSIHVIRNTIILRLANQKYKNHNYSRHSK